MRQTVLSLTIILTSGFSSEALAAPLSLDQCVAIAVEESGKTKEAEGKVREWEARLFEVESVFYPKLMGMAYVAPTYSVRGDLSAAESHWQRLSDWGPYTHVQALLAQPLYTFGRAAAGKAAATARAAVEKARVREVKNAVALEVKKLYYMRLFAKSMLPALESAAETAQTAVQRAEELYEEGSGEVTQTDIMKLRYAQSELGKFILMAKTGVGLAESALKHTMGLAEGAPLELDLDLLPKLGDEPGLELGEALRIAARERPEWTELAQGKTAAEKLELAEKLANAPVVFLGGMVTWDWSNVRDHVDNPLVYDPFNQLVGGVAVGLQFNIDPALAAAKAEGARALGEQVEALRQFASTGIPLQVKKAHDEVAQYRELVTLSDQGVAATKKWLAFAASAYSTGTGEAKDLLEGLVAYLQARRGYYENLQAYHIARAELAAAIGRY